MPRYASLLGMSLVQDRLGMLFLVLERLESVAISLGDG